MLNNINRKDKFIELLKKGDLMSTEELSSVLMYHFDLLHAMCTTPSGGDKEVIDKLMEVVYNGKNYPLDRIAFEKVDPYRFGSLFPFMFIHGNIPLIFMTAEEFEKTGDLDAIVYPDAKLFYRFYISDEFLITEDNYKRNVIHSQIVSTGELKRRYSGGGRLYHTYEEVRRISFYNIYEFEVFCKTMQERADGVESKKTPILEVENKFAPRRLL